MTDPQENEGQQRYRVAQYQGGECRIAAINRCDAQLPGSHGQCLLANSKIERVVCAHANRKVGKQQCPLRNRVDYLGRYIEIAGSKQKDWRQC